MDAQQTADEAISSAPTMHVELPAAKEDKADVVAPQRPQEDVSAIQDPDASTSSPAGAASNPEPNVGGDKETAARGPDEPMAAAEDVAMDVMENQKVEEALRDTAVATTVPTPGEEPHPEDPSKRDVSMPPARPLAEPANDPPSKPHSPLPATTKSPTLTSNPTNASLRLPPVSYIEAQAVDRPLNVTDALSYLDAVKVQFHDQPDVYNHFLDIMKDFKSQLIDTPGVIRRVSHLFSGHPTLIQGFNTFLPAGYRIECSSDPLQSAFITVTTPTGTVLQSTHEDVPGPSSAHWSTFPRLDGPTGSGSMASGPTISLTPDPSMYGMGLDNASIEPAVQYVQKIKQRCDEATYRRFLEILGRYHNMADAVDEREVSAEIARLFKDDPDLRSDFRIFMPEKGQASFDEAEEGFLTAPTEARRTRSSTPLDSRTTRRRPDISLSSAVEGTTVPQKRKRKLNEREREREIAPKASTSQRSTLNGASTGTPLDRAASPTFAHRQPQQPPYGVLPISALDDTHFFDRVKRAINNRDAFNEFLRLINLFTQELIDTARLVREARNFIGEGELMRQFREILGWDDRRERERWMLEEQQQQQAWARAQGQSAPNMPLRPGRINTGLQQGSYRRMPASEAMVTCSGRDEMCKSVLNDEWVSHPTWSSEDSGFIAHKKNIYEEALHRSEEERHEYDFHIEAIVRTIGMLEPINNKIAQLSPEERAVFKLKPNLGGSGKSIHQRIIKKIYGREAGLEVLQAMQEAPALAIPVVLTRLKDKEEEWKRAQREWNKIWREVDARNYQKSLDHQGIIFKTADKKAITAKAFVSQIEAARDEQMDKRASYIDPLFARTRPKHQLVFEMEDEAVLQDVVKMTLSLLDRTQGQINVADRKKIEGFLRSFVPLFFAIDPEAFNRAFVITQELMDVDVADDGSSVADEAETASATSGSSSRAGNRGHRKGGGISSGNDLRKKLLKSEQAKSTNRKTRTQEGPSPATSRPASPALPDTMIVDNADEAKLDGDAPAQSRMASRKYVFFGNNIFYVLLRLLEVIYSRLSFFKNLAASMVDSSTRSGDSEVSKKPRMPAVYQIAQLDDRAAHAEHFYGLMLESCERLFDNEIEQYVFEEQMRYMFGVKHAYRMFTIDKVLGALIKQVQLLLSDPRSQDLFDLLKRDRGLASPTNQDQLTSRRLVESIMGPDENLYRIDWIQTTKTMTIQLLGKDDSTAYDAEILAERWQTYIDSYVSDGSTHGLPPTRLKYPFLKRNVSPSVVDTTPNNVVARGSLEIRVCVRTYRLFYVPHTEDYLCRITSEAQKRQTTKEKQARWLEKVEKGQWPPSQQDVPCSS